MCQAHPCTMVLHAEGVQPWKEARGWSVRASVGWEHRWPLVLKLRPSHVALKALLCLLGLEPLSWGQVFAETLGSVPARSQNLGIHLAQQPLCKGHVLGCDNSSQPVHKPTQGRRDDLFCTCSLKGFRFSSNCNFYLFQRNLLTQCLAQP